MKQIPGTTPVP